MSLHKKLYDITHDGLDQKIEDVKWAMTQTEDLEEIDKLNKQLDRLIETKNKSKEGRIRPRDVFSAAVSVTGLLAVIFHEETNVITSKAGTWVTNILRRD